ncbi:hypothetical protein KBD49_13870 [Myxococcota bacterium]|nr:hypothetical protein [Myxococcota bacterium]
MRPTLVLASAVLLAAGPTGAREKPRTSAPGRPEGPGTARMVLGPVVLKSFPEDRRGQSACLEVWMGTRRMAGACRQASPGQVFFRRIRLESRRSLPVTLRVRTGTEVRRWTPDPSLRTEVPSGGGDAVLAQGLPDLVTSYGPEETVTPRPRDSSVPFGERAVPQDSRSCRFPLAWPDGPGEVTMSCRGWEFEVRRVPGADR